MFTTGVIDTLSEIRWDIRPVPNLGTIEMRICDGLATLEEVGAVAALTQCLVHEFSTTLDNGGTIPTMPPWHVQENKWRAARYGMEAIIILDAAGQRAAGHRPPAGDPEPARARSPRSWAAPTSWPTSKRSSAAARATSASGAWPPKTAETSRPWCWTWSSRCGTAPRPKRGPPVEALAGTPAAGELRRRRAPVPRRRRRLGSLLGPAPKPW